MGISFAAAEELKKKEVLLKEIESVFETMIGRSISDIYTEKIFIYE